MNRYEILKVNLDKCEHICFELLDGMYAIICVTYLFTLYKDFVIFVIIIIIIIIINNNNNNNNNLSDSFSNGIRQLIRIMFPRLI